MAGWWTPAATEETANEAAPKCVECGRPVVYLPARTPYERLIRMRQVNHRLCQRCARVTAEVGEDMDGLRRKKRFLLY